MNDPTYDYYLRVFPTSVLGNNIPSTQQMGSGGGGQGWGDGSQPYSFVYNPLQSQLLSVGADNNYKLDDDPASGQTLTEATTLNGVTWDTNTIVQAEYGLVFHGSDGQDYTVVAISFAHRDANGHYNSSEQIVALGLEDSDHKAPPPGTTLTYTGQHNDNQKMTPVDPSINVTCFSRGTMIRTDKGDVAIEDLKIGDRVVTRHNDTQDIVWIGSQIIKTNQLQANLKLIPIRIRAGALGPDLPTADLVVSPEHRILICSRIAEQMMGTREVLVAAKQLVGLPGVERATDVAEVEYFHFLCHQHEVVLSNGAPTESLYTGPEALKSITKEAVDEIFAIFSDLPNPAYTTRPACQFIEGDAAALLVKRHRETSLPLAA